MGVYSKEKKYVKAWNLRKFWNNTCKREPRVPIFFTGCNHSSVGGSLLLCVPWDSYFQLTMHVSRFPFRRSRVSTSRIVLTVSWKCFSFSTELRLLLHGYGILVEFCRILTEAWQSFALCQILLEPSTEIYLLLRVCITAVRPARHFFQHISQLWQFMYRRWLCSSCWFSHITHIGSSL